MGSLLFDGSNDFAVADTCPLAAQSGSNTHLFTIGVWFKPSAVGVEQFIAAFCDAAGDDFHTVRMDTDNTLRASSRTTGTTSATTGVPTDETWASAVGSFAGGHGLASGNDRQITLDGGTLAGAGTTRNAAFDTFALGCRVQSGADVAFYGGRIGYVAIWDVELSATEVDDFHAGTMPQEANLVEWWDLTAAPVSGVIAGQLGAFDLNVTGATFDSGDSPPVSFGGGTHETVTWASSYAVSDHVTTTWASSYTVADHQSRTWESSYAVDARVTTTWASSYAVADHVTTTWTSSYGVGGHVSTTWESSYGVKARGSVSWASSYQVADHVTVSWASSYDVADHVSTSWESIYTVTARPTTTWASTYAVEVTGSSHETTTWQSSYGVSEHRTTTWQSSYGVADHQTVEWASSYVVNARVSTTWASSYETNARASVSWESSYTVTAHPTVTWVSSYIIGDIPAAQGPLVIFNEATPAQFVEAAPVRFAESLVTFREAAP